MSEAERARALFYGLALGDSLGWPIEFLKVEKTRIIYGEEGIQEPPDPARYTDETQTTLAIAEALIDAGEADIETLMKQVTRRLIDWSNSPENDRAPGHTVTEAVRTLEAGVSWQESGIAHARGNGSAVRVAPIGFLYQHDPDRLREVAHATGIATHAHPVADAAAIAAAYTVKLALDGVDPPQYVEAVRDFCAGISDEFDTAMEKVAHVLPWTDERAALEYLGSGWVADEVLSMALYCAARFDGNFGLAVRKGVNHQGDSDSVGCVTGGIVAARLGLVAIPPAWVERLENRDLLADIANRLAEKKASLVATA